MKISRLVIAALSVAAATVYADDADPCGQFATATAARPAPPSPSSSASTAPKA